jgi:hypothetical protein
MDGLYEGKYAGWPPIRSQKEKSQQAPPNTEVADDDDCVIESPPFLHT